MLTTYVLTEADIAEARRVATDRHRSNLARRRRDLHGASRRDGAEVHLLGALGELVAHRVLGLPWHAPTVYRGAGSTDVGPYHIRTTRHRHGCLILHPKDPDAGPAALVVVDGRDALMPGWIKCMDGKRGEFWRELGENSAFFVPQAVLHPWRLDTPPPPPRDDRPGAEDNRWGSCCAG